MCLRAHVLHARSEALCHRVVGCSLLAESGRVKAAGQLAGTGLRFL